MNVLIQLPLVLRHQFKRSSQPKREWRSILTVFRGIRKLKVKSYILLVNLSLMTLKMVSMISVNSSSIDHFLVTDRLAYLNFVQGSLASSLAVKLDAARAPLKLLRDAETAITPRRNIRTGLEAQIARVEHDSQKGNEKRLVDLKVQLTKAETDDLPQEREIELLKRKAIRESESQKWEAIREVCEFRLIPWRECSRMV